MESSSPSGKNQLETWLDTRGTRLSVEQWATLDAFLRRVSEENEKVNITADSGAALYLRHAADAFAALPVLRERLPAQPKILDLGAGAGFIGVTLKTAWTEADVTLLESSRRKFQFLNLACQESGLRGLHVMLGSAPGCLGQKRYDAVIVRAVAHAGEAARLGLRCARPDGGLCLLYQSSSPARQPELLRAVAGSNASVAQTVSYRLPDEGFDRFLVILKTAPA